ncbi:nucleotide exchange factor GrpE [Halalkalibacillus sediminis]|uniref:Protein GrpE n=1 Tax=Halalkalibacillus sediminis TaxID=2018042 RepID=A0A2I0QXH6_9BACI|nr:nucleotide exchange factor GrpE [Halalkalibacillus sediminis]
MIYYAIGKHGVLIWEVTVLDEKKTDEQVLNDQDVSKENVEEQTVDTENNEENEQEEKTEVEQLIEEKEELNNRLIRLQADFDNYRRRVKKEKENDLKYKSQDLATELIPVLDNFERALQVEVSDKDQSFVDGVKMVYQQLQQSLANAGIEEIEAENESFDPQKHQAIMQVEEEGYESDQVVEVLQKGYQLKDRVIRPAMVKVNQ